MIQSLMLNGREVDLNKTSSFAAKTEFELATLDFVDRWLGNQEQFKINTSGSTGKPKSITMLRHQMEASARATNTYFGLVKKDRIYLCLNPAYIAGQMVIVRAMLGEFHLIADEPSATPALADSKDPIHFIALIPLQVKNLLSNGALQREKNLKAIIIGGSALDSVLEQELQSIETPAYATFGMTETVSHIALRRINGPNKNNLYETLPGIKIDTKNECLTIQGEVTNHMKLITNDRVKLVGPTSFEWLGRADNVVNSGGIKIQIEEVERSLSQIIGSLLPATRFICSKQKSATLGEKLVLVLEASIEKSESELLLKKGTDLLPKYWVPKEILSIVKFPETDTGKIDRKAIELRINGN